MKRKITAVLLCVALLLTLSVNVSAQDAQAQTVPVTNEIMINVSKNNTAVITEPITTIDSGATRAAAATPIGHLDTVSTSTIGGWAYQSNIPNTALTVHIYIINNSTGEQKIIPVTAGGYRADLAAAGYGNGYHAFNYGINWKTYKPGTYTVRAYAIGVNSVNPQLSQSPKSFTVRNPAGGVDVLRSRGIVGYAWKPDAPNSVIDVHIYIYKSDNTQVAFYPVTANKYRSDLASAGYGEGNHGFTKTIDWSTLPEEKLRIVVYAVDGSGYNPSIYSGYFNNLPIHLIGMIDEYGNDHSMWVTQEVYNYAENIGAPIVYKCIGATKNNLINYIHNSRFDVVYTHGSQHYLGWSKNLGSNTLSEGLLEDEEIDDLNAGYIANTDCLLIMACSTASTEDGDNNIATSFLNKGIKTVVAFTDRIISVLDEDDNMTTEAAGYWAKVFVKKLGEGSSVFSAKTVAFSELVKNQREKNNMNTSQLEIEIINRPEWVKENIYCGTQSSVILGDSNLVVKQ